MRRGIALPMVLATVVALGLLGALALGDAVTEWRASALAADQVRARVALDAALDRMLRPDDLPELCLRPALATRWASGQVTGAGRWRVAWRHVGAGLVRAVAEGEGVLGARARAIGVLRPDSSAWEGGTIGCPAATGLVPAGAGWLVSHPAG